MNRSCATLAFLALATPIFAQDSTPKTLPSTPAPATSVAPTYAVSPPTSFAADASDASGFLVGDRMFPNFIGFMSNPVQNIDPRAMTSLWPMFGSTSFSGLSALPSGDTQLIGAGLYVALSDRFSFGLNQGGYSFIHLEQGSGPFRDRFRRLRDRREFNGNRDGWLNFGGFFQYTVIADAESQFLLTTGLRWSAPTGSHAVFQGNGPAYLAPYATIGKGWGDVHLLATTGYHFPVGSGGSSTNTFYANFHLDRQFGWFYPLVEVNCTYYQSSADADLPTRFGLIDMGSFTSAGNIVTLAVGANAVIVPNKLEFGAVYTTPLATQRDFDFNGVLVKMVYRY